jgi:Zn-dependent peptidase ImmA (M78 family)/transcriptional regulator with XRE-family HTH domain
MTANLFEVGVPPVSGERVRQGRELLSITQSTLAEAVGVDQTMIAHIERGAKQPTAELLDAIATTLQLPSRFFRLPTAPELPQGTLLFRAKAGVGKRVLARAHAHAELVFEMAYSLSRRATPIPVTLPRRNDPIESAKAVRAQMGYQEDDPATGLIRAIERLGVIVIPLPHSDDCDAFAVWAGTDREIPVMGLVVGKPADRTRMNAAHELGHLVLHSRFDGGTPLLEREAYEFAAELLMPAAALAGDFAGERLNLFYLARLKAKWQVSMQALARRAKDLAAISDRQYRYIMKQISARGWRTVEPEFTRIRPELPRAVRKMAEVVFGPNATTSQIASEFDLSEAFVDEVMGSFAGPPADRPTESKNSQRSRATIIRFKK